MANDLRLFDTGEAATEPLPPQIATMHKAYGVTEGQRCLTCAHLFARRYHDKTYWKCDKSAVTRGAGSDWRKSWRACGLWQKE